jgi:hypothetical protein
MGSGTRTLVAVIALAGLGVLAFKVLHRSSRLEAPQTLGSMVLLQKNPAELKSQRHQLSSRGIHDTLLALYGPPGSPSSGGASGFALVAGRMRTANADLRQAMALASAVTGGRIRPFTERLAGSDYTCGTFASVRGQATLCLWEGARALVLGIGYQIDGTTTISMTAAAKLRLGLAD